MIDNDEVLKTASAAVQEAMTEDGMVLSDADRLTMAILAVIRIYEEAESRQARQVAGMDGD